MGSWTVATLRTVVCFKLGIDLSSSQNDILALEGESLCDSIKLGIDLSSSQNDILALEGESLCDSSKVCATGISGGKDSLLTYTRIQQFQLPLPTGNASHVFAAPSDYLFHHIEIIINRDVYKN